SQSAAVGNAPLQHVVAKAQMKERRALLPSAVDVAAGFKAASAMRQSGRGSRLRLDTSQLFRVEQRPCDRRATLAARNPWEQRSCAASTPAAWQPPWPW